MWDHRVYGWKKQRKFNINVRRKRQCYYRYSWSYKEIFAMMYEILTQVALDSFNMTSRFGCIAWKGVEGINLILHRGGIYLFYFIFCIVVMIWFWSNQIFLSSNKMVCLLRRVIIMLFSVHLNDIIFMSSVMLLFNFFNGVLF